MCFELVVKTVSKLEDRSLEIIHSEKQKEKRMNKLKKTFKTYAIPLSFVTLWNYLKLLDLAYLFE